MKPLLGLLLLAAGLLPATARNHLVFDGDFESATVPATTAVDLDNRSFTIEFWTRRDELGRGDWAVGQGTTTAGEGLHVGYRGDDRFVFSFWNNDLVTDVGNDSGQWVHWACVYDATTGERRIHRNGTDFVGNFQPLVSQTGVAPYTGSGALVIGGRPQGGEGSTPFRGALDDLRIWGKALSGEEIYERFARPLDDAELADPDLLAYYPIENPADLGVGTPGANDLEDLSASAAHADLSGSPELVEWQSPYSFGEAVAVTHLVTTADDIGPGSLRHALEVLVATTNQDAQSGSPGAPLPLILVDCRQVAGTIALSAPLEIDGRIILQGSGKNRLTLDGGGSVQPLRVTEGSALVLRDLTVANGLAQGQTNPPGVGGNPGMGGALFAGFGANVRIERADFVGNTAIGGGGSEAPGQGIDTGIPIDDLNLTGDEPGLGGSGGAYFNENSPNPPTDGNPSIDGLPGGDAGPLHAERFVAPPGQPGTDGPDGVAGSGFQGGGRGLSGAGGGGGASARPDRSGAVSGDGGRGGNGGDGGRGGYGAGGGAGGGGGGSGGGGALGGSDNVDGSRGADGDGGLFGFGGLFGGFGTSGNQGTLHPDVGGAFFFPGFGGDAGRSGAGAGMGGAIFVAAHGTLELYDVVFANNKAQGGDGGNGAYNQDGRAVGPAVHLMYGARLNTTQRVQVFQNLATRADGVTPETFIPDSPDIFATPPNNTYSLIDGSYAPGAEPLYYYAAEDTAPGSAGSAVFRYRWELYGIGDLSGEVEFRYAVTAPADGVPSDPDPSLLFGQAERDQVQNVRDILVGGLQSGSIDDNLEAQNLLLDLCYDTAVFEGFLAGFRASQIERDARILDPAAANAVNYSLTAHIDAYADPADGVLARFRRAADCYQEIFTDPAQLALFTALQPLRPVRPLDYIDAGGLLQPAGGGPGTDIEFADLVLLFEILAGYGDAAHRLAELYLRRDAPGDRDLGLATAEDAARYLATSSLSLNPLVPAAPGRALLDARENWRAAIDRLTDIQSHHLSGINALGFPDDFLLIVGGSNADSYDTLLPAVQDYVGDAVADLGAALTNIDTYNSQRDAYRDRLQDLLFGLEDRLAEIGDEDSGLIREQTLRILNANDKIRLNRTEIDNIKEGINIEFQLNEELKAANIAAADIRVEYLDQQRRLDQEIATVETLQQGADIVAGLFEPSDPLTTAQKIARGANFVFQVAGEIAIADLEQRKHELAGAEILALARADNVPLDAQFRAFGRRALLDLKRLSVESDISANLARQEFNRLADLLAERDRLAARFASLRSPASAPGAPAVDEGIATRFYANPIQQVRVTDATGRADTTFRRAQLWMFILQRALEYKWNQPFENTDSATPPRTYTAADLFAARNARDLGDLLDQFEDFDLKRSLDFPEGNFNASTTIFSVRRDFLGYVDGIQHRDPQTGQLVDAVTAFRSRLEQLRGDGTTVTIPFHTLRTLPFDSFFRGAVYTGSQGNYTLANQGVALNKINWVKVHIEGDFGSQFTQGLGNSTIRYGGTTFVRRLRVGTLDPARPDRVIDELVPYETRSYLLSGGTFPPQTFRDDIFDGSVTARVTDTAANVDITGRDGFETNNFADRSVAATEWEIVLTVVDDNFFPPAVFPLDRVDDIEFAINHRSADRIE